MPPTKNAPPTKPSPSKMLKKIARSRKEAAKVRTNQIYAAEELYQSVVSLLDMLEEFETGLLRNAGKR